MKVRSAAELNELLAGDLVWRKRELSSMKFLLEGTRASSGERSFLLRGSIALIYAHWEGYIKIASQAYVEYLNSQRLIASDVKLPIQALAARRRIKHAAQTNSIDAEVELLKFLSIASGERLVLQPEAVSTKSNLSSNVLRQILEGLALDFGPFESESKLIDESLLKRRNGVAHGEFLLFEKEDVLHIREKVLSLLEAFRTQVDNACSQRAHLLSAP